MPDHRFNRRRPLRPRRRRRTETSRLNAHLSLGDRLRYFRALTCRERIWFTLPTAVFVMFGLTLTLILAYEFGILP